MKLDEMQDKDAIINTREKNRKKQQEQKVNKIFLQFINLVNET